MSITSVTLPSGFAAGSYNPPFNPSQSGSSNVVSGETQVIAANFGTDVQFLVPSYAPFFDVSVVMYFTPTSGGPAQLLHPGIDYFYGFPFISGSRSIGGVNLYGALILANNQLAGTVSLSYSTLGGSWTNTVAYNQSLSYLTGIDPYVTAWEQVTNYAQVFPILNTPWDKPDPTGIPAVISAVLSLASQISSSAQLNLSQASAGIAHEFNFNNPHNDNPASIGLSNVSNFLPAGSADLLSPASSTTYISPAQLSTVLSANLIQATDTVQGLFKLNGAGNPITDSTNNTRAMTAASFATLVSTQGTGLNLVFNKSQRSASFTPYPFTFPRTWNGNSYNDMPSLLQAISTFVGVFPLEFSVNQGKIWFPAGVTVPSLAVS